jgi:hypothetical protein
MQASQDLLLIGGIQQAVDVCWIEGGQVCAGTFAVQVEVRPIANRQLEIFRVQLR